MGHLLSCAGIQLRPRITEPEPTEIPIHHKCRNCGEPCDPSSNTDTCAHAKFTRTGTKDQPAIIRPIVPNNKVRWLLPFDYCPIEFTSEKIRTSTKEYVDRDPRINPSVDIPWNTNDVLYDRRSYHGLYKIINRVPQNPCGRTGITGRGHLGHFGPNHAADPIVTRWKRDKNGVKVLHKQTRKPILQFVCIVRRDTNEYAIPGGMVDKQEKVTETLQREFREETLNFPELGEEGIEQLKRIIKDIFETGGTKIYCGYVDDPRNTDNAWMETTVYNFHDEDNQHLALIEIRGGDDATKAFWQDLDSQLSLFASHADFLRRVAGLHKAHW